jgi:hypothetical protein
MPCLRRPSGVLGTGEGRKSPIPEPTPKNWGKALSKGGG